MLPNDSDRYEFTKNGFMVSKKRNFQPVISQGKKESLVLQEYERDRISDATRRHLKQKLYETQNDLRRFNTLQNYLNFQQATVESTWNKQKFKLEKAYKDIEDRKRVIMNSRTKIETG